MAQTDTRGPITNTRRGEGNEKPGRCDSCREPVVRRWWLLRPSGQKVLAGPWDRPHPWHPARPAARQRLRDPEGPAGPAGPITPGSPLAPAGPGSPCGPTGPRSPLAPAGPLSPCGPAGPSWSMSCADWASSAATRCSSNCIGSTAGVSRLSAFAVADFFLSFFFDNVGLLS
jgi:hypothetical protein